MQMRIGDEVEVSWLDGQVGKIVNIRLDDFGGSLIDVTVKVWDDEYGVGERTVVNRFCELKVVK